MATELQAAVLGGLRLRQQNSLRALQRKVEADKGYVGTVHVSAAQQAALQAAYDIAKASGVPIPDNVTAAAKALGLK